jgi:hypothetical protein
MSPILCGNGHVGLGFDVPVQGKEINRSILAQALAKNHVSSTLLSSFCRAFLFGFTSSAPLRWLIGLLDFNGLIDIASHKAISDSTWPIRARSFPFFRAAYRAFLDFSKTGVSCDCNSAILPSLANINRRSLAPIPISATGFSWEHKIPPDLGWSVAHLGATKPAYTCARSSDDFAPLIPANGDYDHEMSKGMVPGRLGLARGSEVLSRNRRSLYVSRSNCVARPGRLVRVKAEVADWLAIRRVQDRVVDDGWRHQGDPCTAL